MKNYNEMAESVLTRRDKYIAERRTQMKKLTAVISCLCICAIAGIGAWQGGLFDKQPVQTLDDAVIPGIKDWYGPGEDDGETVLDKSYVYKIDEGQFSTYMGGKVIAQDKVGGKVADVTLTSGWINATNGEWHTGEQLRGEVYAIEGVGNDVAVALKFIDKGEALTTTHYYVIMNPAADLSAVEDYIITPYSQSNDTGNVAE